jgi:ABC-type multidrug transport system fused ATPase/permease subunit
MEIVKYLIDEFLEEYYFEVVLLIILSLIGSILTTNVITYFNSTLINAVQKNSMSDTILQFKYFVSSRVWMALFVYGYKLVQDVIMTNLKQWLRFNLIKITLKTNNENLSNINFTKLNTPINRLAETCYYFIGDALNYTLPYFMFVFVSILYFLYQNTEIGIIFLIGNILWGLLIYYVWPILRERNINYENNSLMIEQHLVENLNNVDKIVSRGQIEYETMIFDKEKQDTIDSHRNYYYSVSTTKFAIELITIITMFVCVGYSIQLFFNGKLDSIQFVALFTLLMVFKERMNSSASLISDAIEQMGRLEAIVDWFKPIENKMELLNRKYSKKKLPLERVEFKDVSFAYNVDSEPIFQNTNIIVETNNHKIIGITGQSGKGKSTFTKLLLKLYKIDGGIINIDNENIEHIDPDYLRKHITYINQNSRLFDKTVLDNILYGCKDENTCKEYYKQILQYPKIKELYQNVNLEDDLAGYSGEKISGGQRQIANIISGLVNPSKILILDEPTNALDKELKTELLDIIRDFKPHKQCIFIITHDKDVYPLFDEQLKL